VALGLSVGLYCRAAVAAARQTYHPVPGGLTDLIKQKPRRKRQYQYNGAVGT
jgi:hypothetical protein